MTSNSPLHHERVIAAEMLSPSEREQAQRLFKLAFAERSGLVLVGAMRGWAHWDLRALVLEPAAGAGILWIIRASDPALYAEELRFKRFTDLIRFSCTLESVSGTTWGIEKEQIWIRRKFFPDMLAAINRPTVQPSVESLVSALGQLHSRGFAHGHVCPSNIGLLNGNIVLVDTGISAFSPSIQGVLTDRAPECKQRGEVSVRSDLYGLGLVLHELYGALMNAEQSLVVQALLRSDPQDRPGLEVVERAFGLTRVSMPRAAVASGAEQLRTGKVLGQSPVVLPEPTKPVAAPPQKADQPETPALETGGPTMPERRWAMFLLLGSAIFIAFGMWWFRPNQEAEQYRLRTAWDSGKPEMIEEVARRAVYGGDSLAQKVIVSGALEGRAPAGVRANLIRVAFNPLWVKQLSPSDRQVALTLALSSIIRNPPRSLPPLAKTHPAIILAAVGDLSLKSSEGQFKDIPLANLIRLPPPYGLAFAELSKLKLDSMGTAQARALSHIVSGDASSEALDMYLSSQSNRQDIVSKLLIVLPFTELYPSLADSLFGQIPQYGEVFLKRQQWFSGASAVDWEKLSTKEKLFLCVGLFPDSQLSVEYLADLLRFPSATIRGEAERRLAKLDLPGGSTETLRYLSSEDCRFSRDHLISFIMAIGSAGKAQYGNVAKWFETSPDTDSVLGLLLARTQQKSKLDAWNVEAARYLANREFRANLDQLRALAFHSEPLARALAYSHLDPSVPEERQIVRDALEKETSAKIRAELIRKLDSAAE